MRVASRVLRALAWTAGAAVVAFAAMLSPIAYVEAFCTAEPQPQSEPRLIGGEWKRSEAATYLTYPEWHIVYAYEELAEIMRRGDEHEFGFLRSVAGFWSSYCQLNREAQEHGGGSFETRSMIYVIGVSFTAEMALKALYEETVGRIATAIRGDGKAPEDRVAAEMVDRYARFLRQVPWYKYPFSEEVARLKAAGGSSLRSWERRLALTAEWKAKEAYASLIAVAAATGGGAKLEIRSAVRGIAPSELGVIDGVKVLEQRADGAVLIETPRYRRFTAILQEIAAAGGQVEEIAGNDDILASVLHSGESEPVLPDVEVLSDLQRQGFGDRRALVSLKVRDLAGFLRQLRAVPGATLEHVYDY